MGNCIRRCFGEDSSSDHVYSGGHYPGQYGAGQGGAAGAHQRPQSTFTYDVVGFTAVARDLQDFETTRKVPGALGQYVTASKATQIIWYEKLLAGWKRAKPAPASAEEVAVLVIRTLQGYNNFQGLLEFYHLPWPTVTKPTVTKPTVTKPTKPLREVRAPQAGGTWPKDVKYEIRTLPVEDRAVGDGDGFTVFVDVYKDAREKENLPTEIQDALDRWQIARAKRDFKTANALQKQIEKADYKVFDGKDGGVPCLTRKYKIRLKGVDAPEIDQEYGKEAQVKLNDLVKGHRLLIHVYGNDQFDRTLGDVHCKGIFIQEVLLKEGCVWHFKKFDKRPHFAQWERDAQAARRGLWAVVNPQKPWDYRKQNKNKGHYARKRGA